MILNQTSSYQPFHASRLTAVFFLAFSATGTSFAGFYGSQAFDFVAIVPNDVSTTLTQSFSFDDPYTVAPDSGEFVNIPNYSFFPTPTTGLIWGDFGINAFGSSIDQSVTISSTSFGTFNGTVFADELDPNPPADFYSGRNIRLFGFWTPGNDDGFGGDVDTVGAFISISLTKASAGSVVNGSMTFNSVPEPSSLLMVGVCGFAFACTPRRKRRRQVLPETVFGQSAV